MEDSEDYRAFEAAVIGDYDAQTAVERELVLRLASLLWRLRRIISIETDLLKIQSDISRERRAVFYGPPAEPEVGSRSNPGSPSLVFDPQQGDETDVEGGASLRSALPVSSVRDLTCFFIRLSNVDNGAFDRLGRYNCGSRPRRRCFCSRQSADLRECFVSWPHRPCAH